MTIIADLTGTAVPASQGALLLKYTIDIPVQYL